MGRDEKSRDYVAERERFASQPHEGGQGLLDDPDPVDRSEVESFPASDAPGMGGDPIPGEAPRRKLENVEDEEG